MPKQTATKKLNPRQKAFARQYVTDHNATRAAKAAGYSEKSAHTQAHDLLKNPKVIAEIARLETESHAGLKITKEMILAGLLKIATVGAEERPVYNRHGEPIGVKPVDLRASQSAWETIGKHFAMWVTRNEVTLDGDARRRLDLLLSIIVDEVKDDAARARILARFQAAVADEST